MSNDTATYLNHNSFLQKKKFNVKTLAPVFVGSGNKLAKDLDYFVTQSHTLLLDLQGLAQRFVKDHGFLDAISKGDLDDYIKQAGEEAWKLTLPGKAEASQLFEAMFDGMGKPIIPGSSIKGGIRTALFFEHFEANGKHRRAFENTLEKRGRLVASRLEQQVFSPNVPQKRNGQGPDWGKAPNFDLGRVLKFGDATFTADDLEVLNTRVMNLKGPMGQVYDYGWKDLAGRGATNHDFLEGTAISVMSIAPESQSREVQITIDKRAFDDIKWPSLQRFDFQKLASILNDHAKACIEFELNFLTKVAEASDELDDVARVLKEDILSKITALQTGSKIAWVQQVGWGTGWHSKTGMFRRPELIGEIREKMNLGRRGHNVFPKSRKISGVFDEGQEWPETMMGWVLVEEVD